MGSNSVKDWDCFFESARQHIDILFVVSAGNGGFNIDKNHFFPASFDLENIVVVISSDPFRHLPRRPNYDIQSVDSIV